MRITLYKGCILTNNYQEVFDTKIRDGKTTSVFEDYLATLDKRDYDVNSFLVDSGSFNISYSAGGIEAIECNYLKIQDGGRIIYAFVDSVVRSNNCITVNYTVDVFHTYFPKCTLRDSLVGRYRKLLGNREARLPLDYDSNKGIEFERVDFGDTAHTGMNGVTLIAKIQIYDIVSGENESNRNVYIVYIDTENVELVAQNLESLQGTKNVKMTGSEEFNKYYEINEYYFMPAIFDIYSLKPTTPLFTINSDFGELDCYVINKRELTDLHLIYPNGQGIQDNYYTPDGYKIVINRNFKLLGFGLLTDILRIENNNHDITIGFSLITSYTDIKIFININAQLIEITDAFVAELPFTGLNAEQYSQRKIARIQGTTKGITRIMNGVGQVFAGVLGANGASQTGSMYNTTESGGFTIPAAQLQAQFGGSVSNIFGGMGNIVNGISDIWAANAKKYQTTYGCSANSSGQINAMAGITLFYIVPANENEVNDLINEIGYEVLYKLDDIDNGDTTGWDFNAVKFINAKVVGNCPQNILAQIKQILENGVKVWYTTNVS